jgi:hypothetical protein
MSAVIDTSDNSLRCTRCGAKMPLRFPIAISDMVTMSRGFQADHARCRPKDAAECWGDYRRSLRDDRGCCDCTERLVCERVTG